MAILRKSNQRTIDYRGFRLLPSDFSTLSLPNMIADARMLHGDNGQVKVVDPQLMTLYGSDATNTLMMAGAGIAVGFGAFMLIRHYRKVSKRR